MNNGSNAPDGMIAERMTRFAPSPTTAMSGRARQLIAEGRDIIKLSSGEPDLPVRPDIREAATSAIDHDLTRATNVDGMPDLKAAIALKFSQENRLDYTNDQIIVSTGAKQVIANAILATVGPGDEAIIPAPYWVSYPDLVKLAGGVPVFVTCDPDRDFTMAPDALEAAITPSTKWLILNNPNNPSGAVWDRDTLAALADVLARHPHVHVISDDIYEHLVYDNAAAETIASVAPDLKSRTLTVNGMSKAFAMSGWRLGYGAGPAWLIAEMAKLQSQVTSNASTVSQRAAIAALTNNAAEQSAYVARFKSRRDRMLSALKDVPRIKYRTPRGAFYVFANCEAAIGCTTPDGLRLEDDGMLAEWLLEAHGIALVPGSAFGMPNFLRLSYSVDEALIDEAGARLTTAFASLA
jgi:aspartate aminotransferase